LRAIAVVGSRRASELPDVPTFIENGIKGLESATIYGIVAPKGTPADVIAKLNVALGNTLLTDEVRTSLQRMGLEAAPSTPERHGAAMRQEQAVWSQVVRQAGISAQ
jgi:tripartite-type tricarboxylate transporter receptor subunit TctC